MDESALFFCMVPTTSVTKNSISGRKNTKKRLTVVLASNTDGSFKLPYSLWVPRVDFGVSRAN